MTKPGKDADGIAKTLLSPLVTALDVVRSICECGALRPCAPAQVAVLLETRLFATSSK